MYCCAHGACHCQYGNTVQFKTMKMKYRIDKDVVVDYTVQDKTSTSTRDWIGIFPRGWINLQQYLTFEYVVVSPKTSVLPNRSIIFLHTFHREASPNIDYQFVYVSKEIEILGTSSYFRFVVPPRLRPRDRNVDTPSRGAVNVGYPPSIVSPVTNIAGKMVASSKSGDHVAQSKRIDHLLAKEEMHRVCTKSGSFITNRVQFLLLHNEQLVARLSRLARDLELTQSAVEIERMEQAMLTKKLKAYEIFVCDMFKYLNLMGIVKIIDEDATEIIVQKVKTKHLPSIYDGHGDKSVPTLEHPTMEEHVKIERCNNEKATNRRRTIEFSQCLSELNENVEASVEYMEDATEFSVTKQSTLINNRNEKNPLVNESMGNQQCQFHKKMSIPRVKNLRGTYVTKEATSVRNEREDNACNVSCEIEEVNRVEGKKEDTRNAVDGDNEKVENLETVDTSRCCCNCHVHVAKIISAEKKFDNENLEGEWVVECECDLEVSDIICEMINNCGDQDYEKVNSMNNVSPVQRVVEDAISNSITRSKPSAVLLKARNAKFGIIRY